MSESVTEVAVLGGGCFWCTEAVFRMLKGVVSVLPGYAGGAIDNPTYDDVSSGQSGHAEVIRIEYNPALIKFTDLLTVFFASHDPTSMNRQGSDVGTQYRSAIMFTTPEQQQQAEQFIKDLNASDEHGAPIVTEVVPLDRFYEAEDYHQRYFAKNADKPYCQIIINPKLKKVKEKFAQLLAQ